MPLALAVGNDAAVAERGVGPLRGICSGVVISTAVVAPLNAMPFTKACTQQVSSSLVLLVRNVYCLFWANDPAPLGMPARGAAGDDGGLFVAGSSVVCRLLWVLLR